MTLVGGLPARSLAIVLAAALSAVLAMVGKPTHRLSEVGAKVDLEHMVPDHFADWQIDRSIVPLVPSPQLQEALREAYDQTLTRTYVNAHGERVMLAIAYGSDYGTKGMAIHKPEICYPSQGFQIVSETDGKLNVPFAIPVRRMVALGTNRHEPLTYWIVVGDWATSFGFDMRLAQVRYGLTGVIPDGMLVRISSLDPDDGHAFAVQQAFATKFVEALDPAVRQHFLGKAT